MGSRAPLIVWIGIVLIGAACAGPGVSPSAEQGARETVLPTASPEPTATLDPAAAIFAECADAPALDGDPVVIALRASSSGFDTDVVDGPRHCQPFTITLNNADLAAEHNFAIEPTDRIGLPLFAGDLTPAKQTATYEIPALPAGEYRFLCNPHREFMRGTLVVAP